jgi:hypothetical protein|tara:strand:+ start:183 stop:431 length:249 start_codon:yes stop_codon:yes gene_type:complete
MKGLKIEDVDYIHVEEVVFSVVMLDGSDVLVSERGINMDTYSRETLADDLLDHIQKGKPVEILDDDDDLITFEPDIDLGKTE